MRRLILFLWMACAGPAHGEDAQAPEFLLGDLGVRVDLPHGWRMTRWSDYDFKAEHPVGPILLFAWATDVQAPVDDAKAWGPVFEAKVEELSGASPEVQGARTEHLLDGDAALVDLTFTFGEGGPAGHLYGATLPIEGRNFHLATVAAGRFAARAEKARLELAKRLEVHRPAAEFAPRIELEAEGITSNLPEGWREPLKNEVALVNQQVQALGVEDLDPCWVAMRPRAAAEPDVMVTCQGGLYLGMVDQHSFEGVDEILRKRIFGRVEVPAATRVDLSDRVGFVYHPPLSSRGLYVGVVPYDAGVARTWVVGHSDDPSLEEALLHTLDHSTYSGPHPASIGDQLSYWITYRPFSPVVLVPVLVLGLGGVLGVGGLALVLGRRKRSYEDVLDDD